MDVQTFVENLLDEDFGTKVKGKMKGIKVSVTLEHDPYYEIDWVGDFSDKIGNGLTLDRQTGLILTGVAWEIEQEVCGEYYGVDYYVSRGRRWYHHSDDFEVDGIWFSLNYDDDLHENRVERLKVKAAKQVKKLLGGRFIDEMDDDDDFVWETLGELHDSHYRRDQYRYFHFTNGQETFEHCQQDWELYQALWDNDLSFVTYVAKFKYMGKVVHEDCLGGVEVWSRWSKNDKYTKEHLQELINEGLSVAVEAKKEIDRVAALAKQPALPFEGSTRVYNLATGQEAYYSVEAQTAVICAHEQLAMGNYNTWDYPKPDNHPLFGQSPITVFCGDWGALKEGTTKDDISNRIKQLQQV